MDHIQALQRVNHGALAKVLSELSAEGFVVQSLLLLSPSADDHRFARALFPKAHIAVAYFNDWNLDEAAPASFPEFDLVIASNVLMYAQNPQQWLTNILRVGRVFVFQDLQYRRRSAQPPHFGADGDCRRYALKALPAGVQAVVTLESLHPPPVKYLEFFGVPSAHHAPGDPAVHVCAALRRESPAVAASVARRGGPWFFAGHGYRVGRLRHLIVKRLVRGSGARPD